MYLAPVVVVLLLIIIIILMVVGFVILRRKKKYANAAYPNPMYYNNHGTVDTHSLNHQNLQPKLTATEQIQLLKYCLSFAIGVHVLNGNHGMQTAVDCVSYKAVLENAQAMGSDYDEIKDEPHTETSPEKHDIEDKSVEFTKSSNDYFTLMSQEAQMESITNVN